MRPLKGMAFVRLALPFGMLLLCLAPTVACTDGPSAGPHRVVGPDAASDPPAPAGQWCGASRTGEYGGVPTDSCYAVDYNSGSCRVTFVGVDPNCLAPPFEGTLVRCGNTLLFTKGCLVQPPQMPDADAEE